MKSSTAKQRTVILLPHALDGNIYVRELGSAYRTTGCQVIYGADNLFEQTVQADILHLHWPEAFYRWSGHGPLDTRVARFIATLDGYKSRGAKVVWTIHNTVPHEHPDNPLDRDAYQQVLDRADLLVHHCPLSLAELANCYLIPNTVAQIAIPHGHYLGYPHGMSQDEARQRLGIPNDAYVFLQFGAVRGYKGLNTLIDAWRRVTNKNKWLLVAGRDQREGTRRPWREKLQMAWARRSARISLHLRNIASEDIQTFLEASDCMVLTHTRGLNSGVAVLGMTFGKLVIGPRMGCIEWVLEAGENLAYPAGDVNALVAAMDHATKLDAETIAATNKAVAAGWRWEDMAKLILDHALDH